MATLKDVARESGLTVGTVSRVLNNRGYISEQARNKVYEAMRQLNYQPNEVARSLSKQKSNTIGIIVPHIVHPYFAKMISNLEQSAYNHKHKILLFNSMGKDEREDEFIEMCKSHRVAGVILFSAFFETKRFRALDFPMITIERFADKGIASIECDNYQGGALAAEHLISKNCTFILNFGVVRERPMPADQRTEGFEQLCKSKRIQYVSIDSRKGYFDRMTYYPILREALRKYPQADGIFASSDLIAAQAIQICAENGIKVPEQMKIIGFDDVNISELTTPRITTIHQPVKEMAEEAISMIIRSASGEVVPARTMFPVKLIIREST